MAVHRDEIVAIINGQEMRAAYYDIHVEHNYLPSYSFGSTAYMGGNQEVTITLHGVVPIPAEPAMQSAPREDVVRHLADHCCCPHCPQGGAHDDGEPSPQGRVLCGSCAQESAST